MGSHPSPDSPAGPAQRILRGLHWDLVRAVTGIEVGSHSPADLQNRSSIAFAAMAISWVDLALKREPDSPTVKQRVSLAHYLRQLPGVLRRDHSYVRFLTARSIAALGGMAAGFFIVYAADRFGMGGREVGALTGVLVGTQAAMNLVWGAVADRVGHKIVLTGATLAGYRSMFAIAIACTILGAMLLGFWVREPRKFARRRPAAA